MKDYISKWPRWPVDVAGVILGALLLAGCVESSGPILSDPKKMFGDRVQLQLYALRDGEVSSPQAVSFQWNGALYVRNGGGLREMSAFSVHAFEADDLIVETVSVKRPRITEYALARKLRDGVYFLVAIDEADADELTRKDYCKKTGGVACLIETRDQLLAFARATAALPHNRGGLVLQVASGRRPESRNPIQPRRPRPPNQRR